MEQEQERMGEQLDDLACQTAIARPTRAFSEACLLHGTGVHRGPATGVIVAGSED